MIFVDANFYVRYLAQPATPQDLVNERRAAALFDLVDSGSAEVTTSEAMLAEVAYILSNPRHYGAPRSTVADGLKELLRPRECRLAAKDVSLHALDLWAAHPRLSFPDSLAAAYSTLRGYELATFDRLLSRAPGVIAYPSE